MISADVKPIPIIIKQQKSQTEEQYSLTQQKFNPFSSSPPNGFISKLKQRMLVYNLLINEVNRKSE